MEEKKKYATMPSTVCKRLFICWLDLTFHCGLNCYTKLSGGQTSVFVSCPYLSCLRRVA